MATSFSGGWSRNTRREPPTMGMQLVNFITCGCESSAPFCNLQSRTRTHVVLVIGLGILTTLLSVMTSTFTLSWRFKRWNQIRTAPVSFLNNWILLQAKENVITKMYCFQPEIIDIAVPTFKGNISSSDFLRSVYIISTSYHNLWPMNLLE